MKHPVQRSTFYFQWSSWARARAMLRVVTRGRVLEFWVKLGTWSRIVESEHCPALWARRMAAHCWLGALPRITFSLWKAVAKPPWTPNRRYSSDLQWLNKNPKRTLQPPSTWFVFFLGFTKNSEDQQLRPQSLSTPNNVAFRFLDERKRPNREAMI